MSTNTSTSGMSDTFTNFRTFVSENPDDHEDLIVLLKSPTLVTGEIIEYAATRGFTVNSEDIDAYIKALDRGDMALNDDELTQISGGGKTNPLIELGKKRSKEWR